MPTLNINVDASSKQTRTDLLPAHDGRDMGGHEFPVFDPGVPIHQKFTGLQMVKFIENSFGLPDLSEDHKLRLRTTEELTGDRYLSVRVDDADRVLRVTGDAEVEGTNTGDQDLSGYATEVYADGVANAAQSNAEAYADSLVVSIFRPAGSWDASGGTWPVSGTGGGGGIRRGDTYTVSVAGTMGGTFYDVGDTFYANQPTPGQVDANWSRFEANTSQSTEGLRGTAALATQAEAEDNVTPNDIDIVTPLKWWQAWTKGLTLSAFTTALSTWLLSVLTTRGDLLTRNASNVLTRLGIGTNGQVLKSNGTDPSWQTLAKSDVGLGNVDNTSDADKPVSTAQQTALDLKSNVTQINVYTGAGSYTWNKPAGAKAVHVHMLGAGGGGASGRKSAAGVGAAGGAGGGAGAENFVTFDASTLAASETVVVGAGGAGGASQASNSVNGLAGTAGGQSSFGTKIRAGGGTGGGAASTATSTAGSGSAAGRAQGQSASAGSVNAGSAPASNVFAYVGGAGGCGGGITSGNAASNGGNGGNGSLVKTSANTAGSGGVVDSTAPTNPTAGTANAIEGGGGGAGGASSTTTNAQSGTNGATYGAGGGGGGAARDSVGNSGAGGNGADGIVIVITHF